MKNFLKSKTIWFNALAAAIGVIVAAIEGSTLDETTILLVVAACNIGLRFLTRDPISLGSGAA